MAVAGRCRGGGSCRHRPAAPPCGRDLKQARSAMLFDMETLEAQNRYKILASTVKLRPIAWVTTLSEDGVAKAARYSFFKELGHEPPTRALGLLAGKGRFKDTATNILASGEFVVNLV